MQLAVRCGQLELCRFLLQESSMFQRDEIINQARTELFKRAATRIHGRSIVGYVEEVVDLLATKNETHIDVDLENLKALCHFYEDWPWYNSEVPSLLTTVPIHNNLFAEKFEIAVESHGWPADVFAAIFRSDEPSVFAKRANKAGKTALHWAAGNYGTWEGLNLRQECYYPDIHTPNRYASLIIDLIRQGSDLHGCWDRTFRRQTTLKTSPFLSFLRGLSKRRGWDEKYLSDAVYRWGQVLVEAGLSLREYAAMETDFLRASRNAIHTIGGHEFFAVELSVSGVDGLSMRVERNLVLSVWKAYPTHVPGSWPGSSQLPDPIDYLPDTISWRPEGRDEQEGFRWVQSDALRIAVYPTEPPGTMISCETKTVGYGNSRTDAGYSAQDDHDFFVVRMMNNDISKRGARACGRLRSASALATPFRRQTCKNMNRLPGPWGGIIHKCAFDMRWKVADWDYWPDLRDCTQGRCRKQTRAIDGSGDNWRWSETWEGELLADERHVKVAKRFAQRFCPQHVDVVDTSIARATERAQLAVGPPSKRPERFW